MKGDYNITSPCSECLPAVMILTLISLRFAKTSLVNLMIIQPALEKAIQKLVNEFLKEPYKFFTEADAVARFHQLLDENPIFNRKVETEDGQKVSLLHREYPTFFRFSGRNPTKRLEKPASRGHYDTAILNPVFVEAYSSEIVANREINSSRDESITPLDAVIEFKFHDYEWDRNRAKSAISELGKLRLSEKEAPLRYLIVLTRYRSPSLKRWEKIGLVLIKQQANIKILRVSLL